MKRPPSCSFGFGTQEWRSFSPHDLPVAHSIHFLTRILPGQNVRGEAQMSRLLTRSRGGRIPIVCTRRIKAAGILVTRLSNHRSVSHGCDSTVLYSDESIVNIRFGAESMFSQIANRPGKAVESSSCRDFR